MHLRLNCVDFQAFKACNNIGQYNRSKAEKQEHSVTRWRFNNKHFIRAKARLIFHNLRKWKRGFLITIPRLDQYCHITISRLEQYCHKVRGAINFFERVPPITRFEMTIHILLDICESQIRETSCVSCTFWRNKNHDCLDFYDY